LQNDEWWLTRHTAEAEVVGGENRPALAPTLPPQHANDLVAFLPARQGDHGTYAAGVSQTHGNATGAVITRTRSSTATHRSKKG